MDQFVAVIFILLCICDRFLCVQSEPSPAPAVGSKRHQVTEPTVSAPTLKKPATEPEPLRANGSDWQAAVLMVLLRKGTPCFCLRVVKRLHDWASPV